MEDKIQVYRQPLVTATGIILGFILNFATGFVKADSPLKESLACIVAICLLIGIINLIFVLYRVLRMDYPRNTAEQYYGRTLTMFITGVSLAFAGVLIDMLSHFMDG